MKNLKPIFNLFLFPLLLILFSTFSNALTLTDDFETNENGWTTSGTSIRSYGNPINSDVLRIDENLVWKGKTYSFGSSNANQSVTIEFDMWAVGGWEGSGSNIDYFYVWADGVYLYQSTIPGTTDGSTNVVYKHFSFTSNTDNNGDLVLWVLQNVSAIGSEKAHLDNFTITSSTGLIGCDNSLDTSANSTSPYTIIADMHNITTATTKCISGSTAQADGSIEKEDNYYFTVGSAGTLDITTLSPNGHNYHLRIGTNAGGTQYYGDITAQVHSISTINLSTGDTVYVYFKETGSNEDHYQITFNFTPQTVSAVNDDFTTNFNTTLNANVLANDLGSGIQVITASTTTPSNGTLSSIQTNGAFVYTPNTDFSGTDSFNYTIQDSGGNTATASVTITVNPAPVNQAPLFTSVAITAAQVNIAYTYNITTNDPNGDSVTLATGTLPSWLTLTGNTLSGTPLTSDVGAHSITLTANDGNGGTATQSFTITVTNNTNFEDGLHDFIIVNPPTSRNVNGNLAVAGNTVMCLTNHKNSYGGTCDDTDAFKTSNNYISKFIDIDEDNRTWNSTSSYITLANNFDNTVSKGILWAGLFWQGRFSTDNNYPMRYGTENGASYNLIEMGKNATTYNVGDTINVESLNAHLIKLKVNTGIYNDTRAATVYTYSTSNGTTYAAYADVTAIVRDANLSVGDHNFTVANLTTNEGREGSPGVFGGWSLLVIYQEDGSGHPRNISAYHGFQSLGATPTINISGFKLPSSGPVSSQAVFFSGEGEHLYGKIADNPHTTPNETNDYDWMKISNVNVAADYVYLPGPTSGTHVGNRDNMFNGQLTGILRADITGQSNNLQINNDGVDIDRFDVSTIMETYRDNNPDIDEIFLRGDSNNDYVTPSMIAFATELYVPEVCFDYTVQVNAYDITEDNRSIHSPYPGDLSLTIALQNEEGDFDFTNSQIGIRLVPDNNVTTFQHAFYAPNNVNTFIPALHMPSSTPTTPRIGIGEDVTLSGGTIKRNQRYFVAFDYLLSSPYSGRFEVDLNTTIDFGSGAVPIFQSTESSDIPRCPQSDIYNPLEGSFNVERVGASGAPNQKFPLYTQVVGKDFDFELVAYNQSAAPAFSTELALNDYTVDLELINASPFNDDRSIFTCSNPNPNIIQNLDSTRNHIFVPFPRLPAAPSSRIDLSGETILTDTALKNAAFRVWYIIDKNNTILPHDCVSPDDNLASSNTCFQTLYDTYLAADDNITLPNGTASSLCGVSSSAGSCTNYTNAKMGTSGCYACLHDFFSRSVCSRDNFSIRPASYRIHIEDGNQTTTAAVTDIDLGQNDSSTVNGTTPILAAGYSYKLTGTATSYQGDTVPALSYTKILVPNVESTLLFDTTNNPIGGCDDTNNTAWTVEFNNGQINTPDSSNTLVQQNNVGNYKYHVEDTNWTLVDQASYAFKTFPGIDDCIINNNTISTTSTGQSGCTTNSNIVTNGFTYTDLQLIYRPYQFNISSVILDSVPSAGENYVFMNDFNNDAYNTTPLTMSVLLSGNAVAETFNSSITTNYQSSCVATQNLTLSLDRNMTPNSETLITDTLGVPVVFQQYIETGTTYQLAPLSTISNGADGNTTLPGAAFTAPGMAAIRLHTNIRKPKTLGIVTTVNPIDINYTDLNVSSAGAFSSANLATHIPDGNNTYNQEYTTYFSKITPGAPLYDNIEKNFVITSLYVDIYCDLGPAICAAYGLTVASRDPVAAGSNWYTAATLPYEANTDGNTTLRATVAHGTAGPNIDGANPSLNKQFDGPLPDASGDMTDINVTINIGDPKPAIINVSIEPDPWHVYSVTDLSGFPYYRIKFIGPSTWSGVGNTGQTVDATSSSISNRRLNW